MKPSRKSPEINRLINSILGVDREKTIRENACVFCQKSINPDTDFKDEISRREFTISGICQGCQDKTFGE